MSLRNILLITAALLMTIGTGLVARSWLSNQRAQVVEAPASVEQVPVNAPFVLVANGDVPAGSFLKENMLRWQAWPDEELPENYMIQGEVSEEEVIGAVVRSGIVSGEPISIGRIVKPGERGFLAAVLRPGYRAMAIRVDATSGISGLVFPGDRVDIILTHEIPSTNKDAPVERRASETVLINVRILAMDQVVDNLNGEPKVAKNATLELSPKQAEMLAVVRDIGSLSLSLRSLANDEAEFDRIVRSGAPLAEPDPTSGRTYTWDSDVSRLLTRGGNSGPVVQVSRGNEVQEMRF